MKALLDSGSQANYVSARAAFVAGLRPLKKRVPYPIHVANGQPMPEQSEIRHEVISVPMEIHGHQEKLTLDYFGLATHDVILGLPWLRKHNPTMDWSKNTLSFENCECTRKFGPAQRTTSLADEKMINAITSQPERQRTPNSASTERSSGKNAGNTGATSAPPTIPEEYKRWKYLFQEETDATALPRHQPWDHEITLQEGKQPTFGPIYAMAETELKVLRQYIEDNLKKGHIRESKSPAGYPVIFVKKKDGSLRLCIDYRKLNDITIKNAYALPNAVEMRDRLSHAKIFTALDLRGAYSLVRMKAGEEWKTAFRTRYGHYEYTVMPFGLTNAPATFQGLMNNVLRAHLDRTVIVYLDDILVYSATQEEHVEHVKQVLICLEKAGLRLKPEKCEFHKKEVAFLGFTVGTNGIKMSEDKIRVIKEWKQPKTVTEILAFVGFCNFNRDFIKDYSQIALPLTQLTRKDTPWQWGEIQEKSFQTLKAECIKPPTLVIFRSGEPLQMETDASNLALGACIKQQRDGKWHPIAYYSRKFSGPEERYDVHDKELLAIVDALKHWRIYAQSCSELTIFTDHKNLIYFTTSKPLTPRQARWSERLGEFKFKIVYTPGKDNGRADALSRRSDIAGTKTVVNETLLTINPNRLIGPPQQINSIMTIRHNVPEELQEAII